MSVNQKRCSTPRPPPNTHMGSLALQGQGGTSGTLYMAHCKRTFLGASDGKCAYAPPCTASCRPKALGEEGCPRLPPAPLRPGTQHSGESPRGPPVRLPGTLLPDSRRPTSQETPESRPSRVASLHKTASEYLTGQIQGLQGCTPTPETLEKKGEWDTQRQVANHGRSTSDPPDSCTCGLRVLHTAVSKGPLLTWR